MAENQATHRSKAEEAPLDWAYITFGCATEATVEVACFACVLSWERPCPLMNRTASCPLRGRIRTRSEMQSFEFPQGVRRGALARRRGRDEKVRNQTLPLPQWHLLHFLLRSHGKDAREEAKDFSASSDAHLTHVCIQLPLQ